MPSRKFSMKQWKWHLILPVVVVAIIAMTFVLRDDQSSKAASAQPQADTKQCINALGKLVEEEPIMDGHTKIGELDVYQNSSTGYSCAVTLSMGATEGVAKLTQAFISTCAEKHSSDRCTQIKTADDEGNYKYEAGPAGLYTKGHCINAIGDIKWNGNIYSANTHPFVGHCS